MEKTSSSRLRRLLEKIRRWWRGEPELPGDPYAYRMAPVQRGPKGNSGAAAAAEPEEQGVAAFRISERRDSRAPDATLMLNRFVKAKARHSS